MLSSLSQWCMYYLRDLRSAYGDALLVLTKWSPGLKWCRNKSQFEDIPRSTCLHSSESRALDPNEWGPEFNAHWGHILLMAFLISRSCQYCYYCIIIAIIILRVCKKLVWVNSSRRGISFRRTTLKIVLLKFVNSGDKSFDSNTVFNVGSPDQTESFFWDSN